MLTLMYNIEFFFQSHCKDMEHIAWMYQNVYINSEFQA